MPLYWNKMRTNTDEGFEQKWSLDPRSCVPKEIPYFQVRSCDVLIKTANVHCHLLEKMRCNRNKICEQRESFLLQPRRPRLNSGVLQGEA